MTNVQCPSCARRLQRLVQRILGSWALVIPWSLVIGHWTLVIGKWASLIPKILELEGGGKILGAHGADDGLQIIPAFAGHADFITLDLSGDFQFKIADEGGDLLGQGGFDA